MQHFVICTNTTNLRRDGTFNTAELLDGTVEIVSAASHDAHNQLHVWLKTKDRKLEYDGSDHCIVITVLTLTALLFSLASSANYYSISFFQMTSLANECGSSAVAYLTLSLLELHFKLYSFQKTEIRQKKCTSSAQQFLVRPAWM